MTTIVVMSDIHGNLPALQAVAATMPPADAIFVAGDLCLDGPCPTEVVDFVKDRGWTAIMGNCDRDIVERADPTAVWAADRLGPERVQWLANLPFSARFQAPSRERVLVVHANPQTIDEHLYPDLSAEQLHPYLQGANTDILAFGHLHTPYTRPVDGILLVDVASVGHPKDRDHRAAYTIIRWNGRQREVEQRRVPYDIDETIRLLRESDMPKVDKQIASLLRASY